MLIENRGDGKEACKRGDRNLQRGDEAGGGKERIDLKDSRLVYSWRTYQGCYRWKRTCSSHHIKIPAWSVQTDQTFQTKEQLFPFIASVSLFPFPLS